jgi:hypothetical protein
MILKYYMDMKLIDFTLDNIGKLILKRPKECRQAINSEVPSPQTLTPPSTPLCPATSPKVRQAPGPLPTTRHEYISEVLYLDDETGRLYRPVFQAPKLRVQYGVKQFKEGGIYSYCVGLYNHDIDPEVREFYHVALAYDRHIVSQYQTHKVEWNLSNIRNKYWTAIRRKDKTSDPHFVVKLISDRDGIKTKIYNTSREALSYTDIVYGVHVDQYIGPTYIVFNEGGIYPTWNVHQVVVSQMERVFLEQCLLDSIAGYTPPPPSRSAELSYYIPPPPPLASLTNQTPNESRTNDPTRAMGLGGLIKTADILDAIGRLRKAEPKLSQTRSELQDLIES